MALNDVFIVSIIRFNPFTYLDTLKILKTLVNLNYLF